MAKYQLVFEDTQQPVEWIDSPEMPIPVFESLAHALRHLQEQHAIYPDEIDGRCYLLKPVVEPSQSPKLFIWNWAKDHSWERVIVAAQDVEQARELALVSSGPMPRLVEKIQGEPDEVHAAPYVIYDVY